MRRTGIITGTTAFAAIGFLVALLLAPMAEAEAQAARSRSSASSSSSAPRASSSSGGSSQSSSASSRSSSRGAAVTRSTGRSPSAGPRTTVAGRSTHRTGGSFGRHQRGRYTDYYVPYYSYGYSPYYPYSVYYPYGWSFGLGWWGGYYSPFYSYYSPRLYGPSYGPYGPAPREARPRVEPVGAFDLNVRPKKTEVWVDGHYVGTAGRFDGFPDYLWLGEGKHQLIFFLEGHATVEREVETLAGVVADLRIDMEPGRSIPPRQLAVTPAPPPAPTSSQPPTSPPPAAGEEPMAGSRDLRAAPGRLVLNVEPADASVYLDGRYLGTGSDLQRLHAGLLIEGGSHRLDIVRPGYEDRQVEFTVEPGQEERIEIGLDRG